MSNSNSATRLIAWLFGLSLSRSLSVVAWLLCAATGQADHPDVAWIHRVGGQTRLNSQGQVVAVDFRHCWLTDADLKRLGALSHLEEIQLGYTKVTDQGLEYLKPLQHVRRLDLYFAESISDSGIAHLKSWRKLEQLNMRGTKVTSTVFDHLIDMHQLQALDVGFSRVNDDNLERLGELPQLRSLSLGGNKMSGAALPLLKLIPTLEELDVGGQQRTDSGLWSVTVSDANCGQLAALVPLRSLDLSDTALTDRGMWRLQTLVNLRTLRIARTKVSTTGISALKGLAELQELNCSGVESLDGSSWPELVKLEKLETLHLIGTKVTAETLTTAERPPRLKRLYVKASDSAAIGTLRTRWSEVTIVSD